MDGLNYFLLRDLGIPTREWRILNGETEIKENNVTICVYKNLNSDKSIEGETCKTSRRKREYLDRIRNKYPENEYTIVYFIEEDYTEVGIMHIDKEGNSRMEVESSKDYIYEELTRYSQIIYGHNLTAFENIEVLSVTWAVTKKDSKVIILSIY